MTDTYRRTLPWAADELLRVDGVGLVYDTDADGAIEAVHLPGGLTTTVEALRAAGHRVVLPRRIRREPTVAATRDRQRRRA